MACIILLKNQTSLSELEALRKACSAHYAKNGDFRISLTMFKTVFMCNIFSLRIGIIRPRMQGGKFV